MLYGFELNESESPLDHLATVCCGAALTDATASLAAELLVLCAREYTLLRLHPRLLVACVLRVAVCAYAPVGGAAWTASLAARCGYESAVINEQVAVHLAFLAGVEVSFRSLASGRRERALRVRVPETLVSDLDESAAHIAANAIANAPMPIMDLGGAVEVVPLSLG